MSKSDFETKSLVVIITTCYVSNFLFGTWGYLCPDGSVEQLLLYQIGNAFAISGSVMAARYTGLRGQQVAASACILLGITHGISLGSLGRTSINVDRAITIVMPMIPALVFMFWCELFPKWVRAAGLIPIVLFTLVFIDVHLGAAYYNRHAQAGYATLHVLEIVWAVCLIKDWQRGRAKA